MSKLKKDYLVRLEEVRAEMSEAGDAINPQHYQQYKGLEVIDLTEQLNFNRGNVVKYVTRAGTKPGVDEVEDLKKAKWYIEREIRRVQNEDSN